jgi:hypothetical protein
MAVCNLDNTLHQHTGHLQFRWAKYCEMRNAIDANEVGGGCIAVESS